MLKQIKDMGEEQATRLATRLIANETFVLAVQALVSRTLRTREQLESAVRKVLSSLAVPTADDMETIADRLADIESQMDELFHRIESMESESAEAPQKKAASGSKRNSRSAHG